MINYVWYYILTFFSMLEWALLEGEGLRGGVIEWSDQWVDVVAYGYGDLVQAIVRALW